MDLMERFSNAGVVPVVVLEDAGQALSTARALLAGGIDVMEITFRTDAARDAIQIVAEQCPDMLVGAGTVCSVEQCRQAAEAGARFIVSPGFDPCVVDWCLEHELTVLPGCVTPSEIMEALSRGISTVKFFPASIYGGLEAMKALSGPFVGLQFVPTPQIWQNMRKLPLCGLWAAAGCAAAPISPRDGLNTSQNCAGRPRISLPACRDRRMEWFR